MLKRIPIWLQRIYNCPSYCIGRLYWDGLFLSDTIEDTDRGLKDSWPIDKILATKVYGETAIPKGTYKIVGSISQKFRNRVWAKKYGGIVPEVIGVKGFSGIRIHPATKATELLGCVAPGKNTVKGAVTQSQACYYKLMDRLTKAWAEGYETYITIQ
ncbi:MAG: hypothetical protein J5886_06480 [Bacteroidales bacterium]|nr:hypothetical protein [Bacteroidales bacterium]